MIFLYFAKSFRNEGLEVPVFLRFFHLRYHFLRFFQELLRCQSKKLLYH